MSRRWWVPLELGAAWNRELDWSARIHNGRRDEAWTDNTLQLSFGAAVLPFIVFPQVPHSIEQAKRFLLTLLGDIAPQIGRQHHFVANISTGDIAEVIEARVALLIELIRIAIVHPGKAYAPRISTPRSHARCGDRLNLNGVGFMGRPVSQEQARVVSEV